MDQRPPDFDNCQGDAMMGEVISRLPFFLLAKKGSEEVFGKDALEVLYNVAKDKFDKGTAKLDDVVPLQVWSYLIPQGQASLYSALVRE
eukprot:4978978-Alexandrium_andersonii.AAC.1